jgi:hypothetical protein
MRRSVSLVPAALLCIAAASIGGRVSADPPQVVIHNDDTEDVLVTITDENTPNGAIIAYQQPLSASADLLRGANLDGDGVYNLHWKAQNTGRTRTEEGDCVETPVFACDVEILFAR